MVASYKSDDPTAVIQNWMRNRDVIEFLGLWEGLHNPGFKIKLVLMHLPCLLKNGLIQRMLSALYQNQADMVEHLRIQTSQMIRGYGDD